MTQLARTDKQKTPLQVLSNTFEGIGDRFEDMLPEHVSPKRFRQVALTAVAQSKDLAEVATTKEGRESILTSCLACASDGLIPDGREAALVAFNCNLGTKQQPKWAKLAQYMPMVRGITNKMQQTGSVKDIAVNLVYKGEHFIHRETADGTIFEHEPGWDTSDLLGAYARLITSDGGFYIARLSKKDLDNVQKASKARYGPWTGDFKSEMQKKSAIKRLSKIAPVSRDVQRMLDYDNNAFFSFEDKPTSKPTIQDRLNESKLLDNSEPPEDANVVDQAEPSGKQVDERSPPPPNPVDAQQGELIMEEKPAPAEDPESTAQSDEDVDADVSDSEQLATAEEQDDPDLPVLPEIRHPEEAHDKAIQMWANGAMVHVEKLQGIKLGTFWAESQNIVNEVRERFPDTYKALGDAFDKRLEE